MVATDVLRVGLKVLGVYFGALGVVSLWGALLVLLFASSRGVSDSSVAAVAILRPLAEFVVAFVLVCRTESVVRWCGLGPSEPTAQPLP
jgi:hypothetical protein